VTSSKMSGRTLRMAEGASFGSSYPLSTDFRRQLKVNERPDTTLAQFESKESCQYATAQLDPNLEHDDILQSPFRGRPWGAQGYLDERPWRSGIPIHRR